MTAFNLVPALPTPATVIVLQSSATTLVVKGADGKFVASYSLLEHIAPVLIIILPKHVPTSSTRRLFCYSKRLFNNIPA
jgi:hypothetical protein